MIDTISTREKILALTKKYQAPILSSLVTLLVLVLLTQGFAPLDRVQIFQEDQVAKDKPLNTANAPITVVGIDSRSLAAVGEWPWNHGVLSDLLVTICDYRPQAVLFDFPIAEKMEHYLAGKSGRMALALEACDNVVLSFDVVVGEQGRAARSATRYLERFAVRNSTGEKAGAKLPHAAAAFMPPEIFCGRAQAVGFSSNLPGNQENLRFADLLIGYQDQVFAAAPLQLAALYLGRGSEAIEIDESGDLYVAGRRLPVTPRGELRLQMPAAGESYQIFSAIDILTGEAPREQIAGKAVIVAPTAPGITNTVKTIQGERPAYIVTAALTQQLASGIYLPTSVLPVELPLLLLVGLLGALLLPKLRLRQRILFPLILALGLITLSLATLTAAALVLPIAYPVLCLCLFAFLAPLSRSSELSDLSFEGSASEPAIWENSEPVAVDRDQNKELDMTEVCETVFAGDHAGRDSFLETIRLDYKAMTGDSDPIKMRRDQTPSQEIDLTADADELQNTDTDFGVTRVITPDMLEPNLIIAPRKTEPESEAASISAESTAPAESGDSLPEIDTAAEKPFTEEGMPLQFGRYEVIEPVGMGAMGTVYKGKDPAIDRLVALKTIRFDTLAGQSDLEEIKERFNREAIAAGNLSHPNIVVIYDVGLHKNLQYIAMEFLEGYTLEALLGRNLQLNFRIIATIVQQVCSAIEYAHAAGVIHRDIKPANIMVLDEFRIKVMDFGIALSQSSSMTQTGMAMGTPNYIAPEILRGQEATPRSDIFSLGVVLYELLTHRKPFHADNISALVYKVVHEQPKWPTEIDPKIPALLDMVIKKALAKNPQERYQNAREFASALEDFTIDVHRQPALA
jgi:serine/threonine-protein kinase